jgi:hypothetical protein
MSVVLMRTLLLMASADPMRGDTYRKSPLDNTQLRSWALDDSGVCASLISSHFCIPVTRACNESCSVNLICAIKVSSKCGNLFPLELVLCTPQVNSAKCCHREIQDAFATLGLPLASSRLAICNVMKMIKSQVKFTCKESFNDARRL